MVATITVTPSYTNAGVTCTGAPVTFTITVNPGPVPTITGPTELCAGATGVIYTTEPGYSNYVWTISFGGTITAGLNSNQVTVNWPTAGQRYIAVNYANGLGCSAINPYKHYVTVKSVPVPLIFGEDDVCQGATAVAYSTQPNMSNYVWTVSSGGTITSGAGTKSITVTWNGSGNQTVSVNYTNDLGCEAIEPSVFNVMVNAKPAAAGTITGTTPVCAGSMGVVYTVPVIANATSYNWVLPAGATVVAGANTNSITIDFASNAVSGVIKVNGVNDCGIGAVSPNFNLVVNPLPPTPVITQHYDTLISSAASGNQWYLNGIVIPGVTSQKYVPTENGSYYVVVTLGGCSSLPSNTLTILNVGLDPIVHTVMEVYPNPNHGEFNLKVVTAKAIEANIEIYNNIGELLWKQEKAFIDGNFVTHIDLKLLPAGVYTVALKNKDINMVKRVVVMK